MLSPSSCWRCPCGPVAVIVIVSALPCHPRWGPAATCTRCRCWCRRRCRCCHHRLAGVILAAVVIVVLAWPCHWRWGPAATCTPCLGGVTTVMVLWWILCVAVGLLHSGMVIEGGLACGEG
ncbi:hypothetical protein EDB86DRAFT_2981333 [Lactarius hatsudake]|nr:hypothetical protein EDB86DRAFT_2981333 [Lactarius hatsudake]